jgi:hypothetical protein
VYAAMNASPMIDSAVGCSPRKIDAPTNDSSGPVPRAIG